MFHVEHVLSFCQIVIFLIRHLVFVGLRLVLVPTKMQQAMHHDALQFAFFRSKFLRIFQDAIIGNKDVSFDDFGVIRIVKRHDVCVGIVLQIILVDLQ